LLIGKVIGIDCAGAKRTSSSITRMQRVVMYADSMRLIIQTRKERFFPNAMKIMPKVSSRALGVC
jgi:hypothetical protein